MEVIKELGFLVCAAMVLMVYLKQLLPIGKNSGIVKAIISVFVLLSIVSGATKIDWDELFKEKETEYQAETITESVAEGLKNECNRFLKEQKIDAEVLELQIQENNGYEITYLSIVGADADLGKQLLSARYQISKTNIEVKDEG